MISLCSKIKIGYRQNKSLLVQKKKENLPFVFSSLLFVRYNTSLTTENKNKSLKTHLFGF